MEQIMARQIVVEQGMDYSNRPMIAVYGCYFPDPEHADYNVLLQDCLDRLEQYSESDYVIIFFAGAMQNQPTLSWIYSAYRSLSRKYKKNIKQLYVVHPSTWFKIICWVMSNILSNKFFKKIVSIDNLADLEKIIPITKVFVPPVVSGFDRGMPPVPDNEVDLLVPKVRIFGAEVESVAPEGGVPRQIARVVTQLRESGLEEEGLFRLSPDTNQVEQIRMSMDRDYEIDLSRFSPHALAAALKAYFRQLPTPLIPSSVHDKMAGAIELREDDERVAYIQENVLNALNAQRRKILAMVMELLSQTAALSKQNRMPARNLAAVWTPNLIRCESIEEEMRMLVTSHKFLEIMIDLASSIFEDELK